jgi:hypothetical protein
VSVSSSFINQRVVTGAAQFAFINGVLMLHRSYPARRAGQKQTSPVTSIRFGPSAKDGLAVIQNLLAKRWRLEDKPSLSLLLEGVIVSWAAEMKNDPQAITDLINEIEARGGAQGERNQFALDGPVPQPKESVQGRKVSK